MTSVNYSVWSHKWPVETTLTVTKSCITCCLQGEIYYIMLNGNVKKMTKQVWKDIYLFSRLYQQDNGPISDRVGPPCFLLAVKFRNYREKKYKAPQRSVLWYMYFIIFQFSSPLIQLLQYIHIPSNWTTKQKN